MKKKLKDPEECKHRDVEVYDRCDCCGAEHAHCKDCDADVGREHYKDKWEQE